MPIGQLAKDKATRAAEYRRRKQRFQIKRVPTADVESHKETGWEVVTPLKRGVRIKKQRPADEILENDFWSILYQFGYKELNIGRDFFIEITQDRTNKTAKHVDVFALDDETVVVAECKYSATRHRRSFQKDLGEFEANKGPIARALKAVYGETFNKKIIWLFVTRNIEWSETDVARARKFNIRPVRELEMRYFSEIANRLGPAGRFQFHAEYLAKSQAISQMTVPAIRSKVGGKQCFFFVAPPRKLLPISYVNHRDLRDPEAAPSYQRLITRARLKDVAKYVSEGGYFPNALLVNFKEAVRFDRAGPETEDGTSSGTLTLPSTYKSVWIIDGQHRLYGYAEHNEDEPSHRIPVVAFEKMSSEEEGRLFKTINSEQRKVSKNLIDELRGEQDLHSEDRQKQTRAIAVRVMEQLRCEIGGPFEDRLKSVDLPSSQDRSLTLSQICNAIVTSNLIGRQKHGVEARFIQGPLSRDRPADTINALAEGLSHYFSKVRDANEVRWAAGKGSHLCTNTGVEAYIRLFGELCGFVQRDTGMDPRELSVSDLVEQVSTYLEPVVDFISSATDEQFESNFKVAFGSGGVPAYFYRLAVLVRETAPMFGPEGLDDFLRQTADERRLRADEQIREIQTCVPAFVVKRLKELYSGQNFLQQAVKNQEILVDAFRKQTQAPLDEQGPLETYMDFLDFRKVVETNENWPHFKDELSISLLDEKKGQAKYVKWFDEINRLRRVPAHPFGKLYKDADIAILEHVYGELASRGVVKAM
jgi:DGQHR domain-containing protein